MASDSRLPYNYERRDDLYYVFTNADGIRYHVYFLPMFEMHPNLVGTYSLNIEPEDRTPHEIDRRIALTVVDILRHFFENNENAMIMVCDTLDGKELKRRKLFDRWFLHYAGSNIIKYDGSAKADDYTLYLSIYFTKQNPNRAQLVSAFYDLLKTDIDELVV